MNQITTDPATTRNSFPASEPQAAANGPMDGKKRGAHSRPQMASGMTPAGKIPFMAWLRTNNPELADAFRKARNEYDRLFYDPVAERERRVRTRDPEKEAARKKAWAEEHRDERRAYMAAWREAHRAELRESYKVQHAKQRAARIAAGWTPKPKRKYATEEERREARREYSRRYWEKHRDPAAPRRVRLTPEERRAKRNEYRRAWYYLNSEKCAEWSRRRMEKLYADEEKHAEFLRKRAERRFPDRKRPYRPMPSRMRHAWERYCEAYAPGAFGAEGVAYARDLARDRRTF